MPKNVDRKLQYECMAVIRAKYLGKVVKFQLLKLLENFPKSFSTYLHPPYFSIL